MNVRCGVAFATDASSIMRVGIMVDVLMSAFARKVDKITSDVRLSTDADANVWVTKISAVEFATSA